MKTRSILFVFFSVFVFHINAQTSDYTSYLVQAWEHIDKGNCESAERCYNVYKELTGNSSTSLEAAIAKCKNKSVLKAPLKEILIYQMAEERQCDGIYYGPEWEYDYENCKTLLYTKVPNLKYQHFKLSFDFMMIETNDFRKKNIITIDSDYRILGLEERHGNIIITTDNWRHEYDTGIPVPYGQLMHIDLEYNRGQVVINGLSLNVIVENAGKGKRDISTINFGGGRALYGKIRNFKVYNVID